MTILTSFQPLHCRIVQSATNLSILITSRNMRNYRLTHVLCITLCAVLQFTLDHTLYNASKRVMYVFVYCVCVCNSFAITRTTHRHHFCATVKERVFNLCRYHALCLQFICNCSGQVQQITFAQRLKNQ